MAKSGDVHTSGQMVNMTSAAITAAGTVTSTPVTGLSGMKYLSAQAKFTYGSGGTSLKAYVQTSFDMGTTWVDVMAFAFATTTATKLSAVTANVAASPAVAPTDGSLTDNTIVNGLLGDRVRVKYVSVGTYAGTTFDLDMVVKG